MFSSLSKFSSFLTDKQALSKNVGNSYKLVFKCDYSWALKFSNIVYELRVLIQSHV